MATPLFQGARLKVLLLMFKSLTAQVGGFLGSRLDARASFKLSESLSFEAGTYSPIISGIWSVGSRKSRRRCIVPAYTARCKQFYELTELSEI